MMSQGFFFFLVDMFYLINCNKNDQPPKTKKNASHICPGLSQLSNTTIEEVGIWLSHNLDRPNGEEVGKREKP